MKQYFLLLLVVLYRKPYVSRNLDTILAQASFNGYYIHFKESILILENAVYVTTGTIAQFPMAMKHHTAMLGSS